MPQLANRRLRKTWQTPTRPGIGRVMSWRLLNTGATKAPGGTETSQTLIRVEADPATTSPDGNTVSLEHEMMRSVSARQQHEMALGIYSMARDVLRATIGR